MRTACCVPFSFLMSFICVLYFQHINLAQMLLYLYLFHVFINDIGAFLNDIVLKISISNCSLQLHTHKIDFCMWTMYPAA